MGENPNARQLAVAVGHLVVPVGVAQRGQHQAAQAQGGLDYVRPNALT